MSKDKRNIVRNRDNGGAPSDTRFGEITKIQATAGATDLLHAWADQYDDVVPTGEAIIGREAVVQHVTSGLTRFGERVNLDRADKKVSGYLSRSERGAVFVIDDDGNHWDVFSYEYNNLTPHRLKGFRYQRGEDEADEEDGNPAYPNGRCSACGFGLNDNGDCTNYDCSRSVENDEDAFEEAHAAHLDSLSGVNRPDDDRQHNDRDY